MEEKKGVTKSTGKPTEGERRDVLALWAPRSGPQPNQARVAGCRLSLMR